MFSVWGGGQSPKKIFWSKNKGGEAGLPGPSPGSTTANSNKCYLLMLLYALPPIHSGGSGPADQLFLSLQAEHTLRDVLQYRQTVENLKYHRIKYAMGNSLLSSPPTTPSQISPLTLIRISKNKLLWGGTRYHFKFSGQVIPVFTYSKNKRQLPIVLFFKRYSLVLEAL